ncbi:MAG: hypothetical protein LC754_15065 [Acidobacteria bacterium]|nr:hypothetical protein [Acidobacteriota bacterium]
MRKGSTAAREIILSSDGGRGGNFRRLLARGGLRAARLEVFLFLLLWLAYGAVINSDNLLQFNLQQIGVEAIVERGHFYLEGSASTHLQPLGDVFLHDGHKYAAKQPGQFMAGAVVYAVLRAAGLTYTDNYPLTSALVTFFTTSLVFAASAVAVFRIARALARDERALFWPTLTTLAYALATTVFPYSGIAHHDALATGYLVIAFYLIFRVARGQGTGVTSAFAGLLLGLTLTTSMLPFFMAVACGLYFISLRRWNLTPPFAFGVFVGLLPLLVYDAASFGNPLLLPNVAGAQMFGDTFVRLDPKNFGDKIVFYTASLATYAPAFALGLFGLTYFPRAFKREPAFLLLVALPIVLAAYVLNIGTAGDCQFGPRYMLPAMPFACLGIAGYSHLSKLSERMLAGIVVMLVCAWSFGVNLVGAAQGAMCCPDGRNALRDQLAAIGRGEWRSYPLARWLLIPVVTCALLFVLSNTWRRRGVADDEAGAD